MEVNQILFIGHNKYGQAGIGQKYHNQSFNSPKSYTYPIFIKQISCGSHHSALLTIDGNIYTMGSNIHGALGANPNLNYSFVPTLVQGLNDITKINCGPFHMCAISNGQVYSWGKGIDGQLGQGNTKNISKPTKIQSLKNVQDISCGTNHTLVLINNEQQNERICYAFGNGIYGQLGSGQTRNSYQPIKVNLSNIQQISAGQNHSLFLSKGKVYTCGDNSHGQLGTNSNKKFLAQPTLVQLPTQNPYEIKSIQAKKNSAALTDTGQIYVWGFKANVGSPKIICNSSDNQIIQIRVGNDSVYGLSTNGMLYSWNISKNVEIKGNTIYCQRQTKLSNRHAVLDFSIGDNYMLIMGDIIKQVPYSNEAPTTLQCDQSQIIQSNRQFQSKISQQNSSGNSGHLFIDSEFLQSQKDSSFNNVMMDSSKVNILFSGSNNAPYTNSSSTLYNNKFFKLKRNSQVIENHINGQNLQLAQIKDFNNKIINYQKKDNNIIKEHAIDVVIAHNNQKSNKVQSKLMSEFVYTPNDTYEMVKTPSSSIFGEPHNFLKESINESLEHQDLRRRNINESAVQNEAGLREMTFSNVNIRKKKYTYNYNENKENIPNPKSINKKEDKKKKLDKIIQMLQKSNNLKSCSQDDDKKDDIIEFQNESEIIQSNRILRVQLRQKQVKISQLQELLSRKEMQIQAQRQLIKALRDKNNSNYASLDQNSQ